MNCLDMNALTERKVIVVILSIEAVQNLIWL